jgi:putative toxin-antitoxin system antitoxin component (TIGR02293 family)
MRHLSLFLTTTVRYNLIGEFEMHAQTQSIADPYRPARAGSARVAKPKRLAPTGLVAHDLVAKGIDVADAKQILKNFTIINEKQFYGALGITARTMQRRAASAAKTLDANASDRALRLVSVVNQATEVLGSRQAAELWLSAPAIGLDRRIPIDLLQSSEGTAMVKTLLSRMEYGVYA